MDLRVAEPADPRLAPPDWQPGGGIVWRSLLGRLLLAATAVLAVRYIVWLLEPGRSAQVGLYGLLVAAEAYNLLQGVGFWWTLWRIGPVPTRRDPGPPAVAATAVDVLIPTYDEPVEVVEPTVAAAVALARSTPGSEVRVALLDDGDRPAMADLARRHGATYLNRPGSEGAKSGNINAALQRTDAPYIAVLDCDHVPLPAFLSACLAGFDRPDVAFVQTPQYYANWRSGGVAEASWAQQSLFFGTIARGRDAVGAMFCCGTNVVFRRDALADVGGFSLESLTEDFELSIRLHERGWTSRYVPRVLASGLGPRT